MTHTHSSIITQTFYEGTWYYMGSWYKNNRFLRKLGPFSSGEQHEAGSRKVDACSVDHALWNMLNNRQLGGFKFERQKTLFGNVVGFYCKEAKLAVDLEHIDHQIRRREELECDLVLAKAGVKVLRFHRDAILQRPNSVKNSILEELSQTKQTN